MEVFLVSFDRLEEVAILFDKYRCFYNQSSDLASARDFLRERLEYRDSTIFVASSNGCIIGFTQLYPSWSSVSMQRIWILNDLFVEAAYRQQGVARLLMNAAEKFAVATDAVRIVLSTQTSNTLAQDLYESLGYLKNEDFYHYSLTL